MKATFFVAHDDDLILSSAGLIQKLLAGGNEVSVVLFTNGETSHQVVLNITNNPTPEEVARKRRIEFMSAVEFLGVSLSNIMFLDLPTRKVGEKENIVFGVEKIITLLRTLPDAVYFHHPDCHIDHVAVSRIVSESLSEMPNDKKPKAFQFFIWTRELAQGRSDVNSALMLELPEGVEHLSLTLHELSIKRNALFQMKSQVETWPYHEWQPQKSPILDAGFLKYFLSGEEVFLQVQI